MSDIFLHINVSVDGFIEDREREMDWAFADDEWESYVNEVLGSIDAMIFGRVTHQLLAGYWPTAHEEPSASKAHVEAARMMNALPKYVVTRSPYETSWHNSHVIRGDVAARVRALKEAAGRDIALFAGAGVAQSFAELGLIDEYRLVLNPVLLGDGTPLFKRPSERARLELTGTRRFESGAIVLRYRPA